MPLQKNEQFQILLPDSINEIFKYNPSYNFEKQIKITLYHSVQEIINICNDKSVDIIFLEDRYLNEFSFNEIRDFNLGIILIYSGELKSIKHNKDDILDFIAKEHLSNHFFLNFFIEKNISSLKSLRENLDLKLLLKKQEENFIELHDVGVMLSKENDIDSLLETIVSKSMQLTSADMGSLFLLENKPQTEEIDSDYFFNKHIELRVINNFSRRNKSKFILDLNTDSICGKAIINGNSIIINNNNELNNSIDLKWSEKEIYKKKDYNIKSILTVPIFNDKNLAIGAIQVVNGKKNSKKKWVDHKQIFQNLKSFEKKDLYFLETIASQASVALRNTKLINSVHILFDGFINASVRAIESRDPTTAGHSSRVAVLTLSLAETINQINTGRFSSVNFNVDQLNEIRYASLLHDFGKIGVRERVLVKSKKLFPEELQAIKDRLRLIRLLYELETTKKQISFFIEQPRQRALDFIKLSKKDLLKKLQKLDEIQKFIIDSNEPSILEGDHFKKLKKLAKQTFLYPENVANSFLSKHEVHSLSIKKGSLSDKDRKEIESHVTQTFNFLKIIPWSKNLERVPEIAYAHHEKLNGTGYPCNLIDNEIPLESKMMAIADIYDALTAWDRPYKKAVPQERALDILYFEAKDNNIDQDLLDIFVNAKLYSLVKSKKY